MTDPQQLPNDPNQGEDRREDGGLSQGKDQSDAHSESSSEPPATQPESPSFSPEPSLVSSSPEMTPHVEAPRPEPPWSLKDIILFILFVGSSTFLGLVGVGTVFAALKMALGWKATSQEVFERVPVLLTIQLV